MLWTFRLFVWKKKVCDSHLLFKKIKTKILWLKDDNQQPSTINEWMAATTLTCSQISTSLCMYVYSGTLINNCNNNNNKYVYIIARKTQYFLWNMLKSSSNVISASRCVSFSFSTYALPSLFLEQHSYKFKCVANTSRANKWKNTTLTVGLGSP